jgi:hypothetical protein
MTKETQKAIEEYQCSGCVCGSDIECGKFKKDGSLNIACSAHVAGTRGSPHIGRFFLGMPKGFNRIGEQDTLSIHIFTTQDDQNTQREYDHFNLPIWKQKNDSGHIFIRGYVPRLNQGFLHIILAGNYEFINCHEIDIDTID